MSGRAADVIEHPKMAVRAVRYLAKGKALLAATSLMMAQPVLAESTAITNATLYTGSEQGIIKNASVVFSDGVITAINPEQIEADNVIDAEGKIVTPGFIGSLNSLGIMEVSAAMNTVDNAVEKSDLSFTPILAFNPESTAIPMARVGGVTRDIIVPAINVEPFAGVAGVVSLSGKLTTPDDTPKAAVVYLEGVPLSSRAWTLGQIKDSLQKRADSAEKAKSSKKKDKEEPAEPPTLAEQRLDQLLAGEFPLLAFSDRPIDILQLIQLKQQFKIELIIAGADGAVAVREQLAAAKVPVILDALSDLPKTFDSLHASLNNAALLHKAGVTVALAVLSDNTHGLYQLRFGAGNAIANGLPKEVALNAISSTPARLFGINAGSLATGKAADLVLWSDDPFDFTGQVEQLWIDGEAQPIQSRADKLLHRYSQKSAMPPAYVK